MLKLINPIIHSVHKMVKDMWQVLQYLLQNYKRVFDHFVDIRHYSVESFFLLSRSKSFLQIIFFFNVIIYTLFSWTIITSLTNQIIPYNLQNVLWTFFGVTFVPGFLFISFGCLFSRCIRPTTLFKRRLWNRRFLVKFSKFIKKIWLNLYEIHGCFSV